MKKGQFFCLSCRNYENYEIDENYEENGAKYKSPKSWKILGEANKAHN